MVVKMTVFFFLMTSCVYGQKHLVDTTLVNSKVAFRIRTIAIGNDLLLLTSTCGQKTNVVDTIKGGGLMYIKFPDFNNDGNTDILMEYRDNNSTYVLYLYNPATKKFVEIENYSRFPDAIRLKKNPTYYYSYHRAGCADMNWVSELFRIQNFRVISLGRIEGKGCDFEVEEKPQLIYIYKVINKIGGRDSLIEQLPYLKYIPNFEGKWDFIEKYWNRNYSNFEKKNSN